MIPFSCSHCGMKLKVKPEFAGRSSKCPTCKQPLVVPAPDKTQASMPKGQIDGTDSSLAKAGVDGGVTLCKQATLLGLVRSRSRNSWPGRARRAQRYLIEGEIARGGMGAVLRAVDCDIRREVAVKYLLDQTDAEQEAPLHRGSADHRPTRTSEHRADPRTGRRCPEAAVLLDENGQGPKPGPGAGRTAPEPEDRREGILAGAAAEHLRQRLQRPGLRPFLRRGPPGLEAGQHHGRRLRRSLRHGLGAGESAEGRSRLQWQRPVAVAPSVVQPSPSVSAKRSSKVETSREAEADLTQEGAVLGTPVYMPPEQATGQVEAIDQRSDIYSLGAILYEMLTLQPPVDKEGGYLAILMRVMEGEIVPPEQRDPKRAKAGRITRELSAIAMKALAKNPQDRYPNVEALRKDIERFQEGRSVSAKEDTFKEMALEAGQAEQTGKCLHYGPGRRAGMGFGGQLAGPAGCGKGQGRSPRRNRQSW